MNRGTMSMSASPFQKMSYESATRFLSEAATYPSFVHIIIFYIMYYYIVLVLIGMRNADVDPLQSTSSRIAIGNLVRSGTGLFSVGVRITPVVTEQF